MSRQHYVKSGICERYQALLEECGTTLAMWDQYREKVAESGKAGEEDAVEIFQLQVRYARAYAALQNHLHDCEVCRLIASFDGWQSSDATTLSGACRY